MPRHSITLPRACSQRTGSGIASARIAGVWIGCCAVLLTCSEATDTTSDRPDALRDGPPNIVVVVVDTARPDHLSIYGSEHDTTPALLRLSQRSRVYDRAYSTSTWTAPAHASLLTGLYPSAHQTTQSHWTMSPELHSLPETLSSQGYRTSAIVENAMLSRAYHYDQGFDAYHEVWKEPADANLKAGLDPSLNLLERELDATPDDQRLFLFMNLIAPHSPYDSSRQFRDRFVSDPAIRIESNRWPAFFLSETKITPRKMQHLRELYDAELRYADHQIEQIVAALRRRKRWEHTVFVVTSDHGENFGEHGLVDHVFSLYESTIRATLLVHYPPAFAPGTRDAQPTQLVDLFPTLLRLAEVDAEETPPHQGRDLLQEGARDGRVILCEYDYPKQALMRFAERSTAPALAPFKRVLRAFVRGDDKLIWASDGKHQRYDLRSDPLESRNLYGDDRVSQSLLKDLADLVERLKSNQAAMPQAALDALTEQALRDLGYLK